MALRRAAQLARTADLNIDSFYLNSVPLSPTGYLPLELDAITKSEMASDRANRPDWRECSRSSVGGPFRGDEQERGESL